MRKVGRATPCAADSFTDSSDGNLHNHHKDGDDDHHYGERDHNCNNRDKPDYCDDCMKFMKMNVLALINDFNDDDDGGNIL